jgi:hypothetical protein
MIAPRLSDRALITYFLTLAAIVFMTVLLLTVYGIV